MSWTLLLLTLCVGPALVVSESCTYKWAFRAQGKCEEDQSTCKYPLADHLLPFYEPESLKREHAHECEQGERTCTLTPREKGVPGTCVAAVCKANNGQGEQWSKSCLCAKCTRDCPSADLAQQECEYERVWHATGNCIRDEVPKCKFTPIEKDRHLYDEKSLTKDDAFECAMGLATCQMNPKYKKAAGTCKSDKCHPNGLKGAIPKYNVACLCQLCINHGCLVKKKGEQQG
ncbi:hypothetical protein DdX_15770 [Ditylenchus destructor]|uniref:Uncharacterized protein n=1 Tax=Ditylenchus destructor TaxID=166010 RepID=A0AAD4MUC1_9BILA|nr:hypothetical protein DdX_15753 [Ditylenchus destructor]KAI1701972.1 hypothetical protein DdX_15756 [Ditylenchus destructor]KAI1701986.1 hypothetical protein DdX_15770 [Ditylenchus destructor]